MEKALEASGKILCAECGATMVLRDSRYGKFYGCSRYPRCKGTHGAHDDGRPLGTPADADTKRARVAAHSSFDKLWRNGRMTRRQAYKHMRRLMRLPESECHIGKFTKEQCYKLIEILEDHHGL